MKTRNEVREIALRIIYKINIFDDANVYYDVDDLIKEEYEVENDFVNSLVNGVIENKDDKVLLMVSAPRKKAEEVTKIIRAFDDKAFIFTEKVKVVSPRL